MPPGLDPDFDKALAQFIADAQKAGHNIGRGSGHRSVAEQRKIIDKYKAQPNLYIASYKGGVRRRSDGKQIVASENGSYHSKGLAHDLKYASPGAKKWAHENASKYGLAFPLSYEDWHIEKAGIRKAATPIANNRKGTVTPMASMTPITTNQATANEFEASQKPSKIAPNSSTPTTNSTTPSMATTTTGTSPEELGRKAYEGTTTPRTANNVNFKLPAKDRKIRTWTLMDGSAVNMSEAAMKQAQAAGKYQGARAEPSVGEKMSNVLPYLSNLYSAGIKPPPVPGPMMMSPTALQRVSMNVDRNKIEGDYRTFANTAQAALGAAEATRAMLGAKAQKFEQMSKINEVERNANMEIANREREVNKGIDQANRKAMYEKQLLDMERQNAIVAQKTANLANVSDKLIAQQAVKDQEALEERKFRIMQENDMYGNLNKMVGIMKGFDPTKLAEATKKTPTTTVADQEDATQRKYGGKMAMGGRLYTAGRFMKTMKPIKTVM